jgi:hypothetical protein
MKRISFFLALTLVIFSFGLVNAQEQSVRIIPTTGFFGDSIMAGASSVVWDLRIINDPSGGEDGCFYNAGFSYRVYSPDGATWGSLAFDSLPIGWRHIEGLFAGMFDSFIFNSFGGTTGAGADSVAMICIFGGTSSASALYDGLDAVGQRITIGPIQMADAGKTICLDTLGFDGPPGYEWSWPGFAGCTDVIPGWLYEDGTPTPSGGACYEIYVVPDLPPVYVSGNLNLSGCHGDPICETYDYDDPDPENDPVTFTVTNGVGSFTGDQFCYTGTLGDVGTSVISIFTACEPDMACTTDTINITVTNTAPTITNCPDTIIAQTGALTEYTFTYEDICRPGDPVFFFINTAGSAGPANVDNSGYFTYTADPPAGDYNWSVGITDGVDTSYCDFVISVIVGCPQAVLIQKVHDVLQGHFQKVHVYMTAQAEEIGGFNFLIAYDASALAFMGADIDSSALYGPDPDCAWEYFTYRYGPFGNCGNACPTGQVRVVGIAETNNGPNHPECFIQPTSYIMFSLNFLVSNDRTLNCMFVPIRFFWIECGDNTMSDKTGERLFISCTVKDFDYLFTGVTDIGPATTLPTYLGAPPECETSDKVEVERAIDFYNGGIDIVCSDSIDARGDINMNGLGYEIADAVMFSNYFIYGLSAFFGHVEGSIAASDCNADGIALSVGDLVYLIRVVIGDAQEYVKLSPVAAEYTFDKNGTLAVEGEMGALHAVFAGNVTPQLLAKDMEMKYNYDGENTNVIIFSLEGNGFSGPALSANGSLVSLEMATVYGAVVNAELIPSDFALMQNYPNPFNPATTIEFMVPYTTDYSLTIYNVTGQVVNSFSGTAEAGPVTIEFDASEYSSGIYFYKLNAGDFSATKKMVLLK